MKFKVISEYKASLIQAEIDALVARGLVVLDVTVSSSRLGTYTVIKYREKIE